MSFRCSDSSRGQPPGGFTELTTLVAGGVMRTLARCAGSFGYAAQPG